MKKYQWANNFLGWIVFGIAAAVYLMTIEPTASFWDCGEFIASAYKLEVGHPPGAPIFMLMGNLASHFASEPSQVSLMLNGLSAIFSALTILFLFWTITHLMRKIIGSNAPAGKGEGMTLGQRITVLGAGAVGALACTFSDTFWFSAVEGEVYAFSSLMTAVVFWLVLKWEDAADEPHSGRWLILIAYLMGVSVAIHLLNLLCIPAIVLVYYFRKTENPHWKGAVGALLLSFGILVAILYGIVQGLVEVAGWFELLFVNGFHLPYNSGVAFYLVLVAGVLAWAIWETMRPGYRPKRAKVAFIVALTLLGIPFIGNGIGLGVCIIIAAVLYLFASKKINPVALNTILIGLLVITIGYSSYALIMVRSAANTPMDQNSPEDIFTLREYLSREQYGETPLFYGQTFVSEVKYENKGGMWEAATTDEGPVWGPVAKHDPSEPDHYYKVDRKKHYIYVDELNTLFPRMYSTTAGHVQAYKEWSDFKGHRVRVASPQGSKWVVKPTFGENLRYFFNYQVNFMYWRYFMWNFAGRQNDIQGQGEVMNGNWITGIGFLDQYRVGPQTDMPDSIAKNKGHNKYYLLPLLLGLMGIFFQVYSGKRGTEQFWVTFLLFFMMGLAIVLYLNQPPLQPRERDYAYVGSFYAFCIWIGIGVGGIIKGLQRLKLPDTAATAALGVALGLLIPLQMVSQTWDDHDRSGRYVARDFGMNYLSTCEPNAIIFTNGDNDTFPLWYAQEVEGYRTDVRVCNLSYLQTDWYIDQMKRQSYSSEPLPIDWKKYEYVRGKHEAAIVVDKYTEMPVDEVLNRIKSDNARDKRVPDYSNLEMDNVPTQRIKIPVDLDAVIAAGLVKPENSAWMEPSMEVYLGQQTNEDGRVVANPKTYLYKHEMIILDMLKNNADWKRPMYFATTVGSDMYMRLDPYFRQDGVAYRILPFEAARYQPMDADIVYDNVMNKYKYGNLEQPGLYVDENSMRMASTFRVIMGRLAQTLADRGDSLRAEQVADHSLKVIPSYNVPYDYYGVGDLAEAYHKIGATEKANELYRQLAEISMRNLNWYDRLNTRQYISVLENVRRDIIYMQYIMYYFSKNNTELFSVYSDEYARYIDHFNQITGAAQTRQGGLNR